MEGVEHEAAPGDGRVDGEVSVPRAKPGSSARHAVARAIAAVAQLGESGSDGDQPAQDLLYGLGSVGAFGLLGGVQHQRLLCRSHELGQVGPVREAQTTLGQDHLGSGLNELLCGSDRQSGVVIGGTG